MKNVSTNFKRTMEERRDFWCEANITFSDGTTKTLGKEDFTISGNSVIGSAESNSFPLGVVVAKHISLSLMNSDDRWSEYDFYLAKIRVYTKFKLSTGATESILEGTFTVIEPETYGTVITLTAMDDCYKLDAEYSTSKAFPLTLAEIVRDSCADCGVTLLTTIFDGSTFEVATQPEGLTHRQVIGLCAMLAGGNAFMDAYNRLSIVSYDFSVFENHSVLDGGVFDTDNESKYASGVEADGGTFAPWSTGYEYDSGSFTDLDDIHVLYQFKSGITIGTDDVVITGIKITDSEGIEYLSGTTGYVLSLENELAEGKEQEAVTLIGQRLIGLKFRVFSGDHIAYPLADFMDCAYLVDRNNNVYQTVLTDISFDYNGFTTLKCSADSPLRNSSKYNSEATKAEVEARKNTAKQISEYDKSVQLLTNLITQSFGVYKTEEILDDGSSVFYMHNKPTIGESQTIWKMTADAFAVSTDGGKTWNAGMDSSGNAVVNVLSAIGISFNWARGGTLTLGGVNNNNGILRVVDGEGNTICVISQSGINSYDTANVTIPTRLEIIKSFIRGYWNNEMYYYIGGSVEGSFEAMLINAINAFKININNGTRYVIASQNVINSGTRKRVHTLFGDERHNGDSYFQKLYLGSDNGSDVSLSVVKYDNSNAISSSGGFYAQGSIGCAGTKHRVVSTDNYAERLLYCYEMPSPMFGDIGEGITDDKGECYIFFDAVFSETINGEYQYYVFLQKEGSGDLWIDTKHSDFFVVKGTPALKFAWEIKARQQKYEFERLESFKTETDIYPEVDYEREAACMVYDYYKKLEDMNYEEIN